MNKQPVFKSWVPDWLIKSVLICCMLHTMVLLGLGLWALWAPQLPAAASSALTALSALLLLGAFAVAAQRLPAGELSTFSTAMASAMGLAAMLYAVGWHWARREIRW